MKKRPLLKKWIFCVTPAALAGVMYFLLPFFPKFTEYVISRGVYRIIAFPLEFSVSLLPFSLTEVIVLLCLPAIIALLAVFVTRLIKRGHPKATLERGCRFVAWFLSLFLFVFMLTDGANFSRMPLGSLMELPDRSYTAKELYTVTADLAQKASAAREKLPQDSDGNTILSVSKSEMLKLANDSYDNIRKEYPFLKTGSTRVKSVALSRYWSYTGITGVYCPWTLEANINTDVPYSGWGHTAAHEIAHTMGFAKENECNFLGYLACITSDLADYEYSGYLSAFIYCINALYTADYDLFCSAYENCSEGVINDIIQKNEYWAQFRGKVMESSDKANDTFIKANGVKSGVLSYNEMVELLLRYYDSKGAFN